jgi:hypothetical protein
VFAPKTDARLLFAPVANDVIITNVNPKWLQRLPPMNRPGQRLKSNSRESTNDRPGG